MNASSTQEQSNAQYPVPRLISASEMRIEALRALALDEHSPFGLVEATCTSPNRLSSLSIRGAALRAALWALSSGGQDTVYVTRLLHAAFPLVQPASPDSIDHDDNRESVLTALSLALNELEAIGDLQLLPRGRWLPAPLRCVPLVEARRWLLLGGRPSHCLPPALRESLEHNGVARLLVADPGRLGVPLPVQSQNDWARMPHEPLVDWTRRVVEMATLSPFEDTEATFECYAPATARKTLQFHRWMSQIGSLQDGRYLSRQRTRFGATFHSLVEVRAGSVAATGPLRLEDGDVRRLMYGLDALTGRSVRVDAYRNGEFWCFKIRNALLAAEHRLFTALGRVLVPPGDSFYPRVWEIPAMYASQVVRALRALSVDLTGPAEVVQLENEVWAD